MAQQTIYVDPCSSCDITGYRYTNLQDAVSYVNSQSGSTTFRIKVAPGTYNIPSTIQVTNRGKVWIQGSGMGVTVVQIQSGASSSTRLLEFTGSASSAYTISGSPAKGDTQVTLSSGGGDFSAGNDILIMNDTTIDPERGSRYEGEWHTVVSSVSNVITLDRPLQSSHGTSPKAYKLTMLDKITLSDLTLTSAATDLSPANGQVFFKFCKEVEIFSVDFYKLFDAQLELWTCVNFDINSIFLREAQADGSNRYGVSIRGACTNGKVSFAAYDNKHAFTYGAGGTDSDAGRGTNILVHDCVSVISDEAHFDSHMGAGEITFLNCSALGYKEGSSGVSGFSTRSPIVMRNCHAAYTNRGFYLHDGGGNASEAATGAVLQNCSVRETLGQNGHAIKIEDEVTDITVDGFYAKNLTGKFIEADIDTNKIFLRNVNVDNSNTNATNNHCITVNDGDGWILQNIRFRNTQTSARPFAHSGTCNDWIVQDCDFSSVTIGAPTVTGSGHRVTNVKGWTTKNAGSASLTGNGSQTAFNIAHGLGVTPTIYAVSPGNNNVAGGGANQDWYISAVDSTNVVITFTAAPANMNSLVFKWMASGYEI